MDVVDDVHILTQQLLGCAPSAAPALLASTGDAGRRAAVFGTQPGILPDQDRDISQLEYAED